MSKKCRALIVDPDTTSRLKLKRAADEAYLFEAVGMQENLEGAQKTLVCDGPWDLAFISCAFSLGNAGDFILQSRGVSGGEKTIFILVLQNMSDSATISRHLAAGFSGFLVEPYSLDAFTDIVNLVRRLQLQFSATKEDAVLKLLLREIFGEVDILHALVRANIEPRQSKRAFVDSCGVLKGFPKPQLDRFYELAEEHLSNLPPSVLLPEGFRYEGNSKRVPVQVEKDLLKRLTESMKPQT